MKSKESLLERFAQKDQEIVKGDPKAIQKQHEKNRLTARERMNLEWMRQNAPLMV